MSSVQWKKHGRWKVFLFSCAPSLSLSFSFHVLSVPGLISVFFFLSVLWWVEPSHMCRNVLMNPTLWSGGWEAEVVSLAVLAKLTLKFKSFLPQSPVMNRSLSLTHTHNSPILAAYLTMITLHHSEVQEQITVSNILFLFVIMENQYIVKTYWCLSFTKCLFSFWNSRVTQSYSFSCIYCCLEGKKKLSIITPTPYFLRTFPKKPIVPFYLFYRLLTPPCAFLLPHFYTTLFM